MLINKNLDELKLCIYMKIMYNKIYVTRVDFLSISHEFFFLLLFCIKNNNNIYLYLMILRDIFTCVFSANICYYRVHIYVSYHFMKKKMSNDINIQ